MKKSVCLLALVLFAACSGAQQKSTVSNPPSAKPAAVSGSAVFTANCASCHQANGKGLGGAYPPLAGNPVVTGPPSKVIAIVRNGLNGPLKVGAQTYNGMMPPWKGALTPAEIAAAITYIRSSWGNHASAVTAAQVSAAK